MVLCRFGSSAAAAAPVVIRTSAGRLTLPSPSRTTDAELNALFRYPNKRFRVALVLCLFTGIFGGHRFYMERVGTGILMLLTAGGLGMWWMADLVRLRHMVSHFNADQGLRRREGRPPIGLDFLEEPRQHVAPPRSGRLDLVADAAVLAFAGLVLGSSTVGLGAPEPVVVVLALIVAVNLTSAGVESSVPVLRDLLEWERQLRAYYRRSPPGRALSLLLRPVFGLFLAPFFKRARSEVRMYLELGGVFLIGFFLVDLVTDYAPSVLGGAGLTSLPAVWFQDVTTAFLLIYGLSTPVGATLNKQVVHGRSPNVIRALSGLTISIMLVGALATALGR